VTILKEFTLIPKIFDRSYLKNNPNIVFRDRELVVEKDRMGENTVLRFKIGDGIRTYDMLQYVSSLYALYPNICLFDKNYDNCFTVLFNNDESGK
jgi:hypothetical protein